MSETKVFHPAELDEQYWRALQGIAKVSLTESMRAVNRDKPELDAQRLVDWDDPERYCVSHLDPNTERGRRYNARQEYVDPRVAVAFNDAGQRVGFAYTAHNVSGSFVERRAKLLMPSKRYLWLRDVVVLPEYQESGVATDMVAGLLESPEVDERQPVSTYIWPQLMPVLASILQRHGFEDRGSMEVYPFGTEEATDQHFMVAPAVGDLLVQWRS